MQNTTRFDTRFGNTPGSVQALTAMAALMLLAFFNTSNAVAQRQLSVTRELQLQGSVKLLVGDELTITDVDGKEHRLRIQANPDQPIGLKGGDIALDQLAEISVNAKVHRKVLLPGMILSLKCQLGSGGRTGDIDSMALLPIGTEPTGVTTDQVPINRKLVPATVLGMIKSVDSKKVVLTVPRHELAPGKSLTFNLESTPELQYQGRSLGMLRAGDVVSNVDAADVSTGDCVVRRIQLELVDVRDDLRLTANELLQLKHAALSDVPGDVREFRNQHYLLTTDISDRQAAVLLDKLKSMFDLVSNYYRKQPTELIELYVVEDITKWNTSDWEPRVRVKLDQGQGVTFYARKGRNQKAAVFSVDKHDVVQHEALHGFCFLTFQSTGPLWYAEGMAEMGQYWQTDNDSVNASPAVIGYLRSRKPETLNSVINATQIEGDTWKAYAWRWSLCHFLSTNPNYAKDFQRLGKALMRKSNGASFENTWRRQANELTFEYHLFLQHLESGLRADLLAWDWNAEQVTPTPGKAIQKKIQAAAGWQVTGALVESGVTYETRAKGEWKLSTDGLETNANGAANGDGRLVGAILNSDFELSDEFDLGTDPDFTAVADGQLVVRCRERMSQIADNEGEVNFAIRLKK